MLTLRARDVALLSPDPATGPLDPITTAYCMYVRDRKRATAFVQVSDRRGERGGYER